MTAATPTGSRLLAVSLSLAAAMATAGASCPRPPNPQCLPEPVTSAEQRWPSLPADVPLTVDVSAPGAPAPVLLGFVAGGPGHPAAGSAVVVTLTNSGASGQVKVVSAQGRLKLTAEAGSLAADPGGGLAGTLANGESARVRAEAVATGEPQLPGDALEIRTGTTTTSADVWIEPLIGQWRPAGQDGKELDLGLVAFHTALTRDGEDSKVVFFAPPRVRNKDGSFKWKKGRCAGGYQWDLLRLHDVEIRVWDLGTNSVVDGNMKATEGSNSNLFCSGHAHLPDGRLLVVGGHTTMQVEHGDADLLHIYDPAGGPTLTNPEWKRLGPKLPQTRWYPTVTGLPDGRMLITSGRGAALLGSGVDNLSGWYTTARRTFEIYDPKSDILVDIPPEKKMFVDEADLATYPGVFVLPRSTRFPEGALFAEERNLAWLFEYRGGATPELKRLLTPFPMKAKGSRSYPYYGSPVLLPFEAANPRHTTVLVIAGQDENNVNHVDYDYKQASTNTAEVFAFDNDLPLDQQAGWRNTAEPMVHRRVLTDATLLPDGQVLVTGGAAQGWANKNRYGVDEAEMFDPAAETFRRMAAAPRERRYHSTALLLPDATVLKAGSSGGYDLNNCWICPQFVADRYFPSYLWRGPRPEIQAVAPSGSVVSGSGSLSVDVKAGTSGVRLGLMRLGSVTHGNDMDQRYVWLKTAPPSGSAPLFTVQAEVPDSTITPPGDYMLFVVDALGVPSKARYVKVALP